MKRWIIGLCVLGASSSAAAEESEVAPTVTFDQAVKTAVANNPSAQKAVVELARADALVHQARSASLPTLYGYGTYSLLDADRTFPGGPATTYTGTDANGVGVSVVAPASPARVIASQNSLSANLLLTVPLVSTRTWAQWSHAADGVDVQRMATEDVKRLVAVGAARAYLAVVAQKRVLEVSITARDTAKQHFDFAKARLEGGVGNRLDLARAEQEYLSDEVQVQNAQLGVTKAREALGVSVGADTPVDSAAEPSLGQTPSLNDALEATKDRPDVKTQALRTTAADHVRRDSWTDYMPLLTGVFQPFYQNPASLTTPLTGWQAQLILTVPFYDGGLRYGQKRERDALLAEARFDYEGALRQARSDVRAAFEEVRRADEALKAATAASDVSKLALDLANKAYQAGATSNLELIDAERRARDAATQTAIAEDGARQARMDLLAASGRFP